ncbi:MAG: hypothetical protein RLZZ68_371 [Bacteroidota bacterium]|jgi:hypothetical protein|nr:DUF3108 domain-containing protein [Flavobacteriia bacterium]
MGKIVKGLSIVVLTSFLISSSSGPKYPTVDNQAFQIGERLRYRISYGFIDAGEAVLETKETEVKGAGRKLYHVVGTGKTLGAFNAVFRVNDRYESYIDQQSIMPWFFYRRVDEGGYKIKQDYTFRQHSEKVDNGKGKSFKAPMGVQDMISCFYFARTLDFSHIKKGKVFVIPTFMDDELFELKIKYMGDEVIELRKGKFKCMRFVPVVQTGRYFKHEEDVSFWVTKDKNRIPIQIKAKIPVGSVKMHLVGYSGLKNELSSKIK